MAEYWVDYINGDNGTGDGSEGNPWKTVQTGINGSSTGDTIYMEPATYPETIWRMVSQRHYVGILNEDGTNGAIVDMQGNTNSNRAIITGSTFTNINFINFNSTSLTIHTSAHQAQIRVSSAGDISFTNCLFENIYYGTTLVNRTDRGCMFYNYNIGGGTINWTFERCVFRELGGLSNSQCFMGGHQYNFQCNFEACTFDMTPPTGTTSNQYFVGRQLTTGTVTATVRNSIIYGTHTNTMEFMNTRIVDDLNYADNIVNGNFSGITRGNCISSNPLFVNPTNGDYTLRPASPGLGAGVNI